MENLEFLKDGWYGRLEDIEEEIRDAGFEVEESNREYITASYTENDETVYIDIRLGGTERTITVNNIEEIERM